MSKIIKPISGMDRCSYLYSMMQKEPICSSRKWKASFRWRK